MHDTTQRNDLLDILRGIAILVVILGHALQGACHGQAGATWLHRFIMSFQMEVFFAISGFAMAYSRRSTLGNALKRRFLRLGIPYLTWVLLFYIADVVFRSRPLSIVEVLTDCLTSGFWFLRALLMLCIALELYKHIAWRLVIPSKVLLPGGMLILFSLLPEQSRLLHYAMFFFTGYALRVSTGETNGSECPKSGTNHFPIRILRWCGTNSLGLYAIHWNVFFGFLSLYVIDLSGLCTSELNTYLVAVILFFVYLIGSATTIKATSRIPALRKILY